MKNKALDFSFIKKAHYILYFVPVLFVLSVLMNFTAYLDSQKPNPPALQKPAVNISEINLMANNSTRQRPSAKKRTTLKPPIGELRGVVGYGDSAVVLISLSKNKEKIYKQGAALADGWVVDQIFANRVEISSRDQVQTLYLIKDLPAIKLPIISIESLGLSIVDTNLGIKGVTLERVDPELFKGLAVMPYDVIVEVEGVSIMDIVKSPENYSYLLKERDLSLKILRKNSFVSVSVSRMTLLSVISKLNK
jgi:hypothetical protein